MVEFDDQLPQIGAQARGAKKKQPPRKPRKQTSRKQPPRRQKTTTERLDQTKTQVSNVNQYQPSWVAQSQHDNDFDDASRPKTPNNRGRDALSLRHEVYGGNTRRERQERVLEGMREAQKAILTLLPDANALVARQSHSTMVHQYRQPPDGHHNDSNSPQHHRSQIYQLLSSPESDTSPGNHEHHRDNFSQDRLPARQDVPRQYPRPPAPVLSIPSLGHNDHQEAPSSATLNPLCVIAEFQALDYDCRYLATLMVFLGEANVPKMMLLRATEPRTFFNRRGEPDSASAPDLGPVFSDIQKLDSVLDCLQSSALIQFDKVLECFMVRTNLRLYVKRFPSSHVMEMKYMASKLVFHTFPADPDTEEKL